MTLRPGRTPCRNCSRHWCEGKIEDYSEKHCTCVGNGMEKVDSVLFIFFCHYQHAPPNLWTFSRKQKAVHSVIYAYKVFCCWQ